MIARPIWRPWTCERCLLKQKRSPRRFLATAAAIIDHEPRAVVVDNAPPGALHDDRTLRQIFDSRDFWKDFSSSSRTKSIGHNAGLFRNKYLTSPKGFRSFSASNLRKAHRIVERVLAASTTEEYKNLARELDRLSDMLCRVIDLSDFVRVTHPDPRMQSAANEAHGTMLEYMNQLNTTTGLNEQLSTAMETQEIWNSWSEEEKVVAKALKKDFSNSAISLPQETRNRFVSLSQDIAELGSQFVDHMSPAKRSLSFPASKLHGMDPRLAKQLTRWGTATLPVASDVSHVALRGVIDEGTRREIYIASRTSSDANLRRLDELIAKRAELAAVTRFDSYAQLTLGDKMARSPESVGHFLQALAIGNKGRTEREITQLLAAKAEQSSTAPAVLHPWDKDFYISQIKAGIHSKSRKSDFLASYFSLGTVMQGLSRLFTRLYGVRLAPIESLAGETWNDDVRRLDVISDADGHVAVLYCDLFSRPGKSPNPAHFTLRCSREIRTHEIEEESRTHNPIFSSAEEATNDGMSISTASGVLKQLPTIALICDFHTPSPASSKTPALLSFNEVQTLFHEMGHAIHSVLGRTSLQEVSGTRCATDVAELPSVLMEHFAADEAVLGLFARHWETDAPLPYEMVRQKVALESMFKGVDMETQIVLAMVDQAYHSSEVRLANQKHGYNTSAVFKDVQRKWGIIAPDPEGTSWQGFFGHLVGYGATYYSYLFDQVLAQRFWSRVFRNGIDGGGIQRKNGERLRESVLKWGGGRDPWRCVAEALGDARLDSGGEEAMSIVGGWGAARDSSA